MKADGGAAFPNLQEIGDIAYTHGGMTLHEYYVGQVMPALIIAFGHDAGYDREGAAAEASKIATTMLAERERTGANNG